MASGRGGRGEGRPRRIRRQGLTPVSALSRLWAWLLEEVPQDGGRTLPFRFLRRAVQPYAFAISI